MSWLKKSEPVALEQASSIPYVILEDGVRLCFDNLYGSNADQSEHYIKFTMSPTVLTRQSTNYWRIKAFPVVIPFSHIARLDNCIINGKLIRQAANHSQSSKIISVTSSEHLTQLLETENGIEEFVDTLDEYDHNFVLVGEELEPEIRIIQDVADFITHEDWTKTAVTICDRIAKPGPRRYCWTKNLPDLTIACRGLASSDDMDEFTTAIEFIGVDRFDCQWSGENDEDV